MPGEDRDLTAGIGVGFIGASCLHSPDDQGGPGKQTNTNTQHHTNTTANPGRGPGAVTMATAQAKQKAWYDQSVREREVLS